MDGELITMPMKRVLLGSYAIDSGPPLIRCSLPFGLAMLHTVNPQHHALLCDHDAPDGRSSDLCVWVDWGAVEAHAPCSLVVRRASVEIGREDASSSAEARALSIIIDADAFEGGCDLVVEMRWGLPSAGVRESSRHLHLLPPQQSRGLRMTGCLLAPGLDTESRSASGAEEIVGCQVDRGFGVELELLTRLDLRGDGSGGGVGGTDARGVHAVQQAWKAACLQAAGSEPAWLLQRLRAWGVDEDKDVVPTAPAVVPLMLGAFEGEMESRASKMESRADEMHSAPHLALAERRGLTRLLLGEPGVHKSEFRTPPPPHELSFGRADRQRPEPELRGFIRQLQRCGAAAASSITTACYSGTAVHVHVNVRSRTAAGAPLSVRELLGVVLSWARFDLVTARLARPWMWREPSCCPLYASGPELYSGNGQDAAWNQGEL